MRPKKDDRQFRRASRRETWELKLPINENEDMCPVIKCKGFMDFRRKFEYYLRKYRHLDFIWVKPPESFGGGFVDVDTD